MLYIFYKDKLNLRQNKPFIDFFSKSQDGIRIVSKLDQIKVNYSEVNYIFVGTMEFFEVFLKYFFRRNVKIIYRSRGVAPEESFYRNKSWFRYIILSLIELFVITLSKHIIVVSNNHKNHYLKKYKIKEQKVSVIHNYLTKDSYNLKTSNSDKMEIVYVGGLSKWQRIDDIKELFKKLNQINKDISFLICTNKSNIEAAKDVFNEVGNINFESYEDYDELIKRISKCTAGVILRDSNTVNECSSPFKVIDYVSAQLPIIMTDNIGDYTKTLNNKNFTFYLGDTFLDEKKLVKLEDFIKKCYENKNEIKQEMSKYSCKELNAEQEIGQVMSILRRL
ncbi:glycosyltransferase [Metabacillus schmidteae]|uniref:glycosyltransferase n=1 Tax=Metabacillus schmidteae TaxID=2730405 RepID=UPI00158CBB60|nr:glycosyltransferase [Metabacillus schmidteae]